MSNSLNDPTIKKSLATLVMCRPDYFDVSYTINPWMQPGFWQSNADVLLKKAQDGWQSLYQTFLSLGVTVHLVPPQPGLPDMVFTANSAVALNRKVLLARFRHKERLGEEKYFAEFFQQLKEQGIIDDVSSFPEGMTQEGAGDCYWDEHRQIFWAGYGPRSSKEAIAYIKDYFGKPVVALELASDQFYHMDMSLCPLSKGDVLYHPEAFTKESLSIILDRVSEDHLIKIDHNDAANFAVNAVNIGDKIILCRCSSKLESQLNERGYTVIKMPVETFALSGGSVFCMTLRLDQHST